MKKSQSDSSKRGFQRMVLHHIEKIILAMSLAAFTAFVWLGIGTDRFSETDPKKLIDQTDAAKRHMLNPASWESVEALRPVRDNVDTIIANNTQFQLSNTRFGVLRGKAVESLKLRSDPSLEEATPFNIEYDVFRAPVALARQGNADLDRLPDFDTRRSTEDDTVSPSADFGPRLTSLQDLTPAGFQFKSDNSSRNSTIVTNVVAIRALINYQQLWAEYAEKFEKSVGYHPDRDRPNFELIQIQRKRKGQDSTWQDLTEQYLRLQLEDGLYANFSPEVVAPENFDRALCHRIPTITLKDYRQVATHSALPIRSFVREKPDPDSEFDGNDRRPERGDDLFGRPGEGNRGSDDSIKARTPRQGSDRSEFRLEPDDGNSLTEYKVVRFFDLNVRADSDYDYRLRLWLDDPNHESFSEVKAPSGNERGAPGELGGLGSGGIGGTAGSGGSSGAPDDDPGTVRGGEPGGRDPRDRGAGSGSGGPEGSPAPKWTKVPITQTMLDVSVRSRIDKEQLEVERDAELKKFFAMVDELLDVDLRYGRATDWVEVTVPVGKVAAVDSIVGEISIEQLKNTGGKTVAVGDPDAKLLVYEWSGKFGTLVSNLMQARRGDLLSPQLNQEVGILHIVKRVVKKLAEYSFATNKVVLDIAGGEAVPYRDSAARYRIPGEVLLFDLDGKFTIQNTSEDRQNYLNWRFQPDETSEYNLDRASSRRTEPADDGGGPFGGGRGGDGRDSGRGGN